MNVARFLRVAFDLVELHSAGWSPSKWLTQTYRQTDTPRPHGLRIFKLPLRSPLDLWVCLARRKLSELFERKPAFLLGSYKNTLLLAEQQWKEPFVFLFQLNSWILW